MLPVEVAFITYAPREQVAFVFLREVVADLPDETAEEDRDEVDRRLLPIWIGLSEASAIYAKLEGKEPPRPMTHDLMKNLLDALGAKVSAVVVHTLKEHVFHGRIELDVGGEVLHIDSRPSDAIALALRAEAPIFVDERVMDESAILESDLRDAEKYGESLRDALETLDDESYVKV